MEKDEQISLTNYSECFKYDEINFNDELENISGQQIFSLVDDLKKKESSD
jgi:hypothetical protein